jgi:hypothetical protein
VLKFFVDVGTELLFGFRVITILISAGGYHGGVETMGGIQDEGWKGQDWDDGRRRNA